MLCISKAVTVAIIALSCFSSSYAIPHKIDYHDLKIPIQKQVDCLTENIYFEAGYESHVGKLAVAFVTLNRLASGNYGSDVCGVVKQRTRNSKGLIICQFSWTCQPNIAKKRLTIKHEPLYNDIRDLAIFVLVNYHIVEDPTKGATYFHAVYVNPMWGLPRTIKIGNHIFYKSYADTRNINIANIMVNCLYANEHAVLCEALIAPRFEN
jgi:spore germination cell wall hydrolase CwlJ-like protein